MDRARASAERSAFVRGSTPQSVEERYRFEDYSLVATIGFALPL